MTRAWVAALFASIAISASADPLRADPAGDSFGRGAGLFAPESKPRPPPTAQKPSPKIAELGKPMAGAWKCTGAVDKVAIDVALDGAWIRWRVTGGAGTIVQYRTFDAVAKQWTMLELTSIGAHHEATSLGPEGEAMAKWTWQVGDDHREHEDISKDAIELWGEKKAGAAWHENYRSTCKRTTGARTR